MDNIFVFTRPFTSRFTGQYAKVTSEYRFLRVSDFKFGDDVGLIPRMYHHLQHSDVTRDAGLDYEVISRRCRYLRLLDAGLQRCLINAMWRAIDDVCKRYKPVALIGLPMDNYVLDLFDQYCLANGIFTTNPVQSFLPDRTRITRRGEHIPVRTPDESEVTHYRDMLLQRNFRPTWLSKRRTTMRLAKMLLREIVKVVLFKAIKFVTRDPYSFHYNGTYPVGASMNPWSLELFRIKNIYESDLERVSKFAARFRRVVFLPLQFAPESSLDYNIADSRFSRYNELLDTILENTPADVLLIVKEHPDMYGYRVASFFERFKGHDNVVLVDVNITVQQIFKIAHFVLVSGGASTGAEAVVKGQTVVSLGGAFYGGNGAIREIVNFDDVVRWPEWLQPVTSTPAMIDGVVRQILSNTLVGPYDFVNISRKKIPIARQNAAEVLRYVTGELAKANRAESLSLAAAR